MYNPLINKENIKKGKLIANTTRTQKWNEIGLERQNKKMKAQKMLK